MIVALLLSITFLALAHAFTSPHDPIIVTYNEDKQIVLNPCFSAEEVRQNLSLSNEKNDERRTTFQVKSIVRSVDTDEDNSILGAAFELMRRYRKSSWYKEYTDMYNEAVFEINRDDLAEA